MKTAVSTIYLLRALEINEKKYSQIGPLDVLFSFIVCSVFSAILFSKKDHRQPLQTILHRKRLFISILAHYSARSDTPLQKLLQFLSLKEVPTV